MIQFTQNSAITVLEDWGKFKSKSKEEQRNSLNHFDTNIKTLSFAFLGLLFYIRVYQA